ncbi:MAG: hypothetical protein LBM93_11280 [Oscillospiraceae bacterium]|jgi:hypothetical protein|nr:hypothetical protein [Oscillospiraceae bacterium]
MKKIYISSNELEAFGEFRKILKKYKRIYNFSLVVDLAVWIYFTYSGILDAFFQEYFFLMISPIFLVKLLLRFFCNNKITNILSIVIAVIISSLLLIEYDFLSFLIGCGPIFGCFIYFNVKLLHGEKINEVLKNVYGYSHFNELIILNEMKDEDIYNLVKEDIEIALSNSLIKKEIISNNLSAFKRIIYISNIIVFTVFLFGIGLFSYGSYIENSIEKAKDFTPENIKLTAYVKGEIDNILVCAVEGHSYWILYQGKYVYVNVPEKINEPFSLWTAEDSTYNIPVNFIGKIIKFKPDEVNSLALKKQLPDEINTYDINDYFVIQVLTGTEYEIFINISEICIYIAIAYVLLLLIATIIIKVFGKCNYSQY